MIEISSIGPNIWKFLETYGWFLIIGSALFYYAYQKYVQSILVKHRDYLRLVEQKKFDNDDGERIRMIRYKQQQELLEVEKEARRRKEKQEKERLEEVLRNSTVFDTAVGMFEKKKMSKERAETLKNKTADEILDDFISSKHIVVFTKSFCPFSRRVRQLLRTYNLDKSIYEFIDLDDPELDLPFNELQGILEKRHSQKAVPQMFIRGKYIGGFDEIMELSRKPTLDEYFV